MSHEIDVLVAAKGNIALAAERLSHEQGTQVHPAELLKRLQAENADDVAATLRLGLMLQMFEFVGDLRVAVASELDKFSPADLAKLYTGATQALGDLVKAPPSHDNNLNLNFGDTTMLEQARDDLQRRLSIAHSNEARPELPAPDAIPGTFVAGSTDPAREPAAGAGVHTTV